MPTVRLYIMASSLVNTSIFPEDIIFTTISAKLCYNGESEDRVRSTICAVIGRF
jgi:hypothetical protein